MNDQEEPHLLLSELSPYQNQILLNLLELGFETNLCTILLKLYPDDLTFSDFLNRFISDENGVFNHIFIPSQENIHFCEICHGLKSKHVKSTKEEEEKVSMIFKNESNISEEEKSQRSSNIQSLLNRSLIRVKCQICFEELSEQYIFKSNKVNHELCIECLKKYITNEILNNGNIFPLKCPHCDMKILDLNVIKDFFDKTTFMKYHRLMVKSSLNNKKDFLYCPGCFKIIMKSECKSQRYLDFNEKNEAKYLECPYCSTGICTSCNRSDHKPKPCEMMEKQELRLFRNATDIQRCNNCKSYVTKIKGCNHMICVCKYEFCWLCNAEYNVHHYNPDYGDSKMICPFSKREDKLVNITIDMSPKDAKDQSTAPNQGDDLGMRLTSIEQADLEKQEKKYYFKRIKLGILICLCLPVVLLICPIYFFLKDATMHSFWTTNLQRRNCLLKSLILLLLFLISLVIWPYLCIHLIFKIYKTFTIGNQQPLLDGERN